MEWVGVTIPEFAARSLAPYVDRAVVDKSDLSERFDIRLEFTPSTAPASITLLNGVPVEPTDSPESSGGLSIFSAIQQQLGLRLVPEQGSVEVIVVDAAERPAAN
jgi:uncharacterized protein (TIGR03435 family)